MDLTSSSGSAVPHVSAPAAAASSPDYPAADGFAAILFCWDARILTCLLFWERTTLSVVLRFPAASVVAATAVTIFVHLNSCRTNICRVVSPDIHCAVSPNLCRAVSPDIRLPPLLNLCCPLSSDLRRAVLFKLCHPTSPDICHTVSSNLFCPHFPDLCRGVLYDIHRPI